jgi:hypothetical protein
MASPFIDIEGPGDRYGRDARSNGALDKIFRSAAIAREAPCVDENASSDSQSLPLVDHNEST